MVGESIGLGFEKASVGGQGFRVHVLRLQDLSAWRAAAGCVVDPFSGKYRRAVTT